MKKEESTVLNKPAWTKDQPEPQSLAKWGPSVIGYINRYKTTNLRSSDTNCNAIIKPIANLTLAVNLWSCVTWLVQTIMNISQPLASYIGSVEFGFLLSEDIKALSVKKISNPTTFDSLLHPVPGGLYDPALGAWADNS